MCVVIKKIGKFYNTQMQRNELTVAIIHIFNAYPGVSMTNLFQEVCELICVSRFIEWTEENMVK